MTSFEKKLEKVAEILVDYSVKIKPREKVILSLQDEEAIPLLLKTYKKVLEKGAYPQIFFSPREIDQIYFTKAKKHQLEFISAGREVEIKTADAAINFSGLESSDYLSNADPKKMAKRARITQKLNDYYTNNIRWVLTGYPTKAAIKESGLSERKFLNLYFKAIIQDWKKKVKEIKKIKKIFDKADKVKIIGKNTKLELSLRGRSGIICGGNFNMPDGELMYAPVETSVNGRIHFDFPASFHGRLIKDIKLNFKNGKIINFSARKGKKHLTEILKTDRGVKRIGEFGIGLNYGIEKFIGNLLFDEKIGGTIHLALGQSYKECGGKNKSAIHFDMVKDFQSHGEVWVDGKLAMKSGKYLI